MDELRTGLWTWTAPHPSWTPEQGGQEGWSRDVRSYALEMHDRLVLFDPLLDPTAAAELARGRPVSVLLTCYWHGRSTAAIAAELAADVHAPAAEALDLGFTVQPYASGDELPGGASAQPGAYPEECVLWLAEQRALVAGDAFLGDERDFRLQPESWQAEGSTREELRARLRPLLELPVELLLPTHGSPVVTDARGALERALET